MRDRKEVEEIRKKYHPGQRIKLIRMDDPFSMLSEGAMGTVASIDDEGQIHMHWDNHSTLALIPGVDDYEVIAD